MTDDKPQNSTRAQIDANLRRVFEEQLDPELPDHLKSLLDQLRAQDSSPAEGSADD